MMTNRLLSWAFFLVSLTLASAFAPALAQDQDEAEEADRGRFYVAIETWVAEPGGLDYFAATVHDPLDAFNTRPVTFSAGTESQMRYRGGFQFGNGLGALVVTWYAHEGGGDLSQSSPANYIYGETLVHPMYAGFNNDGLADGFASSSSTTLRDLRIDYYRTAFKNTRMEANWFVGWRRVNHDRQLESAYAALITNLPPLIPPYSTERPDLDPGVDRAEVASRFSGRGPGAGMDFFMPVWKEKLGLEGGFNLAVLRGKTDATYRSTTYYYTIFEEDVETVLSPPYVEFEDAESLALIQQRSSDVGVYAPSLSSTASILEGYVGFRWNAWRGLGVFGGFRSTRYDGVGVELRPETVVTVSGTNSQDLAETERSVTYDGFYGGLSYRF